MRKRNGFVGNIVVIRSDPVVPVKIHFTFPASVCMFTVGLQQLSLF